MTGQQSCEFVVCPRIFRCQIGPFGAYVEYFILQIVHIFNRLKESFLFFGRILLGRRSTHMMSLH